MLSRLLSALLQASEKTLDAAVALTPVAAPADVNELPAPGAEETAVAVFRLVNRLLSPREARQEGREPR